MLSCEVKILLDVEGKKYETKKDLAKELTRAYQSGAKSPKVGDVIDGRKIVRKTSDEHFIYLFIC